MKPPIEPHLAVKIGSVELTLETGAVSFETTYNVDMPFSPSAVVTVHDLELEIERILLREPLTPVEVVYGWKDTEGLKVAGMWKGRAIKASSTMEGIVSTLEISCLAEGAGDLYKTDRQVRRKGRVDQIIRQIAQENGLMADVDSVDMEIDRLQVNMTDYDFIRNVLIPYVNSGDEPYSFWVMNGMLFFKKRRVTQKRFVYGLYHEEDWINILSLEASLDFMTGFLTGDEIEVVKTNPNTKAVSVQTVGNPTLNKRIVLGDKKNPAGAKRKRVLPHGIGDMDALGVVKNLYGKLSDMPIRINMTVLGNTEIKPMETVEVLVYARSGNNYELRPISGKYFVMEVKHTVDGSGFFTHLSCMKNATVEGSETAKGVKIS